MSSNRDERNNNSKYDDCDDKNSHKNGKNNSSNISININNYNEINFKNNLDGINGSSPSIAQTLDPSDSRPKDNGPDLWDILIDAVVTICISRKRYHALYFFFVLNYHLIFNIFTFDFF